MKPAPAQPAEEIKSGLIWFLGIASLVAILTFSVFAGVDSRKVPQITFYGTPSNVVAVDVRGAIATPGVVFVQPGDRMVDVLEKSGGFTADADQSLVNLSSRVSDGQMIIIPTQSLADATQGNSGTININTASVSELDQLPGIGTVRAEQIIAHRNANGPFQSVDELVNVDGISANLVETLRPHIRVSGND